jgi:poly(A) polymerase
MKSGAGINRKANFLSDSVPSVCSVVNLLPRAGMVAGMADAPPTPSGKPPSYREDAFAVLKRLRENGHVAYFAGGCVRDTLLGLDPKDWDVATDAPPQRVRQLFTNTQAVGAAFGVILVRHGRSQIEVATFRSDLEYQDGRRPVGVRFTSAEEDAKRRDFTINGLFLDPIENRVIDYVGGQEDLKAKVLRAIGDPNHRFEEDHLRMLRAVRFAARFELQIEPMTAEAIRRHAEQLKRISPERIAEELRLMLTPPTRVAAWEMLWRFGLLQVVFRQMGPRVDWPPYEDQGTRALFPQLAPGAPITFGLVLAGLAVCYLRNAPALPSERVLLSPPDIRRMVQACRVMLKISNDEADAMSGAMDVGHLLQDEPPRLAQLKRFLARPSSSDARRLLEALQRASTDLAPRIQWLGEQFAKLDSIDYAPRPLVTGDDLTALGLDPGPLFKRVLNEVYDAQLEDRVKTKDEAIELAMKLAKEKP